MNAKFTIGNKYKFGKYTWTLLDIQDGRGLFLLSGLLKTRKAFHDKLEKVTWGGSALRAWLTDWLKDNFTADQQDKVCVVQPLSIEEYIRYQHLISNVPHSWWLRTTRRKHGTGTSRAVYVFGGSTTYNDYGEDVTDPNGGVRPALWVELPEEYV